MPENTLLPLIIAHRGASAIAPENTLAAFRQAIFDQADGIEFDVQLSKDRVPIVFHDFTLNRMARKKISTSKLTAAELKNTNVGTWFNAKNPTLANEKFGGETVPTLTETFDFLKKYTGRIYVEIKCRRHEISALAETVVGEIKKTNLLPNIILKSFTLEAILEAKKLLPEICTAALFAPQIKNIFHRQNYLFEQAKKFSADEFSLHYSMAKPKIMERAERENMRVTIWTADNPMWVERARKLGVYAIITNNPARLLAAKKEIFG